MTYKVIARYGAMGFLGKFTTTVENLRRGDKVVLKTERGGEDGEVVERVADETDATVDGEVTRILSAEDEEQLRKIKVESTPGEMKFCRERIKALALPMKLVDAEHLLSGEKIIFYFVADGRVDFRQLVKDIAREYKTRIELRQIGVRDEARLLSELGHCGQQLCCKTFMKNLEPVTMRMAKSQKATLDPTKISGGCGRLMCCLRYEDKVYTELKAKLPKRGSMVTTKKASGKIVDVDVLSQTLLLRTAQSNMVRVHASEVVSTEAQAGAEEGAATGAEGRKAENGQRRDRRDRGEVRPAGGEARQGDRDRKDSRSGPGGGSRQGGGSRTEGRNENRSQGRSGGDSRREGGKRRENAGVAGSEKRPEAEGRSDGTNIPNAEAGQGDVIVPIAEASGVVADTPSAEVRADATSAPVTGADQGGVDDFDDDIWPGSVGILRGEDEPGDESGPGGEAAAEDEGGQGSSDAGTTGSKVGGEKPAVTGGKPAGSEGNQGSGSRRGRRRGRRRPSGGR